MASLVALVVCAVALASSFAGAAASSRRGRADDLGTPSHRRGVRTAVRPALALLVVLSAGVVAVQLPPPTSDRGLLNVTELLQRVAAGTAFLLVRVPPATVGGSVVALELADDD
jgi:hypothetical protein